MRTKEQYDRDIAQLEGKRVQIQQQINNLKQLRAEMLCPHKVGDIITNEKGTKQAKITRVTYDYADYTMFGYWLKKDGTYGTQVHELYRWEWE